MAVCNTAHAQSPPTVAVWLNERRVVGEPLVLALLIGQQKSAGECAYAAGEIGKAHISGSCCSLFLSPCIIQLCFYSVQRCFVAVVRPDLHHIARVDDECTFDGLHIVPLLVCWLQHLQTLHITLGEHSHRLWQHAAGKRMQTPCSELDARYTQQRGLILVVKGGHTCTRAFVLVLTPASVWCEMALCSSGFGHGG